MRWFVIILSVIVLSGCSRSTLHTIFPDFVPLKYEITNEDKDCMAAAAEMSSSFIVGEDEVEEIWERAKFYVNKFANNSFVHITNHYIRSDNPVELYDNLDYLVMKYPLDGGKFQIEVLCNPGEFWYKSSALRNTQLATYYIRTGNMCSEELVKYK